PIGPGPLKGNLEVLGEPFLHYFHDPKERFGTGLSALARWIFATGTFLPYVEGGVGVMGGDLDLRRTNCNVNFVVQGGVGGLVFLGERWALTGGYRFQHVSNANICSQNLGINSSLFTLGVSYFFP
ncbi:MAG: acyloxyacyl hydrolase, partial [Candidatus Rokubacteria bacterium]|nr:acyloxyacyl hydrolase [Candidatus Rokubacteria bacterium]